MAHKKFDPSAVERLESKERVSTQSPELLWKKISQHPHSTVCDLGAGSGLYSRYVAKQESVDKLYAIDISQEMLDFLVSKLDNTLKAKVAPLLTSESKIPLQDSSIDLLYGVNVFHEFIDRAATLAEIRRVLKADAHLIIVDWKKEKTDFGPPFEHRVSQNETEEDLGKAGFTSITSDIETYQHLYIVTCKH